MLEQPGFNSVANSPSRGALTVGFLEAQQSPEEYLQSLDPGVRPCILAACKVLARSAT